ncbi:MAG: ABC transporter substrate-binding protein [Clostridia bacterium]|nr:ABC transporter substrate-binding protein [Clostridia bacterium]
MTAVLANQCDIGFAGPEASIYVYNEGKEDFCQVFAQMTQKDGSFLVARNQNENFNWEDLKGKMVIPGRKGGVPYMTLEYVLKKNGMNPQKDTTLDDSIKFDLMAGAFASGNADYVTLFEPTASMTQEQGKGYIVASVGEAAGEIPYTAYFAKKSYIQENEETIQKFTNAIYKGQQWVKDHSSKEIAQTIQNFFPDTDIKMLEAAIQSYQNINAWSETPVLKEEAFNRLEEVMIMAGELKENVPYDKIVNNKYTQETVK